VGTGGADGAGGTAVAAMDRTSEGAAEGEAGAEGVAAGAVDTWVAPVPSGAGVGPVSSPGDGAAAGGLLEAQAAT
jgi:hypothetical protein